jgi:hypothetical protein
MVDDGARCSAGATQWPAGARAGQGTLVLRVAADGGLSLNDEAL